MINFLDLTIKKNTSSTSSSSTTLEYSVFRKPTQTDHIIPISSNHPFQHKMAAIQCYVHMTYVGRTMRTLSQRIKEHLNNPEKSN
uniref:Uncharacterized protein LOC114329155 n=1 Tax=Diabrotica virgifera virgifera TaxID=50390 RepID=A0A6P7FE34_DIAVI